MLDFAARSFSRAMVDHVTFPERESVYVRWYPKSLEPIYHHSGYFNSAGAVAGAYIHIPFCDQICRFCPFNKRPINHELMTAYVTALVREIEIYGDLLGRSPLNYIYFGGGTPSTLPTPIIERILTAIDHAFGLARGAEITLESHPTHVRAPFLREMKAAGVTRFSSGLQSFSDVMLNKMGAQHKVADCREAIAAVHRTGSNFAADLLFRCEGQSLEDWGEDLKEVIAAGIPHLSLYSLILNSTARQPCLTDEAEMTALAHDMMESVGLAHYASCASGGFDFARPGSECQYELRHWQAPQDQFLGLGAGGIGFLAGRTTVNGLGVDRYIDKLKASQLPIVSAKMASLQEMKRRFFVLGFKTLRVDLSSYEARFGSDPLKDFASEFEQLTVWDFVNITPKEAVLTKLGRVNCDMVSAVFFSADEAKVPHPEEPEIRRIEVHGQM